MLKDREEKADDTDTERDVQRELHARRVAELPDSNVQANRVLNAAKKVAKKRDDDYFQADHKGYSQGTPEQQKEHTRLDKRARKSHFLSHKNSVN